MTCLETAGALIGLASAVMQITGYAIYFRAVTAEAINPNLTSWSLWAVSSVITIAIYAGITLDWAKLALPVTCAFCSILLVAWCLWRGRNRSLDTSEWLVALGDGALISIWLTVDNPKVAYGALLLDTVVSFVPIWRSTYRGINREQPHAWLVWTVAYCLQAVAALARWEGVVALALPLILAICHGSVALLRLFPNRHWPEYERATSV